MVDDRLGEKIEELENSQNKNNKNNEVNKKIKFASSFNVAIDLFAYIVVGCCMGVFIDKMFNLYPIFFIICILISNVAFFYSIIRKGGK